jgi:hypothetical protein
VNRFWGGLLVVIGIGVLIAISVSLLPVVAGVFIAALSIIIGLGLAVADK